MRQSLGDLDDIAAVTSLIDVRNFQLLDVGCADGRYARDLVARGAEVVGVEPDPVQAAKNRQSPAESGLTLLESPAEALPLDDASRDGVFFMRSLHHVPAAAMDAALHEAARVLVPQGFVCVVEPAMDCSHFALSRHFNDETEVRTLAQAALARTADQLFAGKRQYVYTRFVRYDDFETLVKRQTGATYNAITRAMVDRPEVRAAFAAGRTDAGYVFEQPMLLDLYRKA